MADLEGHLEVLKDACALASAAVTARYFPESAPVLKTGVTAIESAPSPFSFDAETI